MLFESLPRTKKKDQNTVPAPRQTFPDGDPRALNTSPPGCCLPRLRLGRAVRVPSTHKKRKTRTQCVLVFLGAMEGTRTPGLLIRSQSLYPAELPTHTLRARNMMYYSTGSELCQHFFAIIFLLFSGAMERRRLFVFLLYRFCINCDIITVLAPQKEGFWPFCRTNP